MTPPFLYFDPGTGAMLVQFVVAASAAVVLFYKRIVASVKAFFGHKTTPDLMGDIDIEEDDANEPQ